MTEGRNSSVESKLSKEHRLSVKFSDSNSVTQREGSLDSLRSIQEEKPSKLILEKQDSSLESSSPSKVTITKLSSTKSNFHFMKRRDDKFNKYVW